ncbi:MAG TPA: hypothetical protein VNT51_00340 [Miltoncostaeaceae bacterium]|nr:hypothetical protein [Miltoncostaeaceae bacterium]
MSIIDELTRQAGRIAGDVQTSIRRARVEGERRLLQRQHRAALEELGERAYALVKSGELPEAPLAAEVAAVEAKLGEIEAKAAEIDRTEPEGPAAEAADGEPTSPEDPSRAAFPMVGGTGGQDAGGDGDDRSPGPGWEAADRFFRKD